MERPLVLEAWAVSDFNTRRVSEAEMTQPPSMRNTMTIFRTAIHPPRAPVLQNELPKKPSLSDYLITLYAKKLDPRFSPTQCQ